MNINRNSKTKKILDQLDFYIDHSKPEHMPVFKLMDSDFKTLIHNQMKIPGNPRKKQVDEFEYRGRKIMSLTHRGEN